MKLLKCMIIGLLVLFSSGCATIFSRIEGNDFPNIGYREGVYPATRLDLHILKKPDELFLFAMLDLPISISFDTLLVPYDLFRNHKGADKNEKDN